VTDAPSLTDHLAYHDYIAVVSYREEPRTVRLREGGGIDREISRDVARACGEYRDRVNANARACAAASGAAPPPELASYLFNPVQWVAFGRSDAVSLTLFDDFDPAVTLMGAVRSPVVQACLAFCPRTDREALGLGSRYPDRPDWPFDAPETWPTGRAAAAPDFAPAPHPLQESTPLLVVTRFKVGGLNSLGGGVAFFQAVLRVLVAQVVDQLDDLGRAAGDQNPQATDLGLTTEAVRATRCMVLDGQGSEDLILLAACTNYSVGITLVTRLRCMTLGDVFDADPRLAEHFQDGFGGPRRAGRGLHARVLEYYGRPPDVRTGWAANHVFSDSHTTLGAVREAFHVPGSEAARHVAGFVSVVAQVDANPGHMLDVERVLKHTYDALGRPGGAYRRVELRGRPHRFLVGRHDYLEVVGEDPDRPLSALPTTDFFRYLATFTAQTGAAPPAPGAPAPNARPREETGFMGFSSSVVVPFPRLGQVREVDHRTHLPGMGLLEWVRQELFLSDGDRPGPRLTVERLKNHTRRLRMPCSLCGVLDRLYQTFAAHLADPYLFDSVLDLYDTFAALYALLTEDLPRYQAEGQATPFGQWMTTRLDGLLEALKNAVDHRVRLMLPNADMRDTAVDLRGGLSKLVAAADVPLKCGLYLVNRALEPADGAGPDRLHGVPLNRVGGVARIGFNPQTMCERMTFPPCRRFLAHIRMDVLHVTRPVRFLGHIHEATHLLYGVDGPPVDVPFREDAGEVYAELLSHLIVFGTDTDLFLRRYVADYSVQPLGYGSDQRFGDTPHEAQARFFHLLLRGFLVTHPIATLGGGPTKRRDRQPTTWPDPPPVEVFDAPLAAEHEDAFIATVKAYGPFHAPFAGWWPALGTTGDREPEKTWRESYRRDAPAHAAAAKPAWLAAYRRYRSLYNPDVAPDRIGWAVGRAITGGRPLSRLLGMASRDQALETVQLVCRLLYFHAHFCYGDLDPARRLHLHRDEATGRVSFAAPAGESRPWNRFQLDATHGGLFCVDPATRRKRVLQQVVVLKTLWDVSSFIRAERFEQILAGLLSNRSPDPTGTAGQPQP
jgi:hypothetical protein